MDTTAIVDTAKVALRTITPEAARSVFDAWAVFLMLAFGVAVKYWPPLAKISNSAIGWINFLGYAIGRLLVGTAHAGPLDAVPNAVGLVVGGFTNAGWAMVLYETLGRGFLEKLLRLKKAVPKP